MSISHHYEACFLIFLLKATLCLWLIISDWKKDVTQLFSHSRRAECLWTCARKISKFAEWGYALKGCDSQLRTSQSWALHIIPHHIIPIRQNFVSTIIFPSSLKGLLRCCSTFLNSSVVNLKITSMNNSSGILESVYLASTIQLIKAFRCLERG